MIAPILLYACEIWGFDHRPLIELVQIKFCKYMINVGIRTPHLACLGECGRKSSAERWVTAFDPS